MTCEINQCSRCGRCDLRLDPKTYGAEEKIIEAEEGDKQAFLAKVKAEREAWPIRGHLENKDTSEVAG